MVHWTEFVCPGAPIIAPGPSAVVITGIGDMVVIGIGVIGIGVTAPAMGPGPTPGMGPIGVVPGIGAEPALGTFAVGSFENGTVGNDDEAGCKFKFGTELLFALGCSRITATLGELPEEFG